jgi:DNA helicase HerA-like ATPase
MSTKDNENNTLIGRVIATEKEPTTIDMFNFWTNIDTKLSAFDLVKVEREDGSSSFGIIESISHITDAASFLSSYISSDFGDPDITEPTYRVGMNYAKASVAFNTENNFTPVHNNSKVFLATQKEIILALGLNNIENTLPFGYMSMYEGTKEEIRIPIKLNPKFLLGPEGAHLNISGISGLAAKTSFSMFLMKAIQDYYIENKEDDESVAFVMFNVKGKDIMAIDKENEDIDEQTRELYESMGLLDNPFNNVKYYIPFTNSSSQKRSTYLSKEDERNYIENKKLKKFKYTYEDDKESIEMMFSNVDDSTQTMEAIISKIIDENDPDFSGLSSWSSFLDKVSENSQKGQKSSKGEISVLSWRKFKRVVNKALKDDMFANRPDKTKSECRLGEELKYIKCNDAYVIDIAKLPEDKQAFVFGDALKTIYNLKLGEFDDDDKVSPPSRIVVFIDELNKYASSDVPKSSPILHQILDITERGRSLGVVLFGAEQFRSVINKRVTGNCATHAYGRTNSIETETGDYKQLPKTYRNMLTRLSQGEYLIQNPVFRSLLKIHFPKPIYKQFK